MKDYGLVSIITATYNSERYIEHVITAIQAQTYTNWELLITDDCSSDNTVNIVRKWADKDKRIRLFVLPENGGAGIARNKSLHEAKGRFIAFCDSDDYWHEEKLEKQLTFMEKKQCAICYSSYHVINEDDNIISHIYCPKKITKKDILHDDSMGMLTMIYDTKAADKQEFPTIRRRQDWAMKILLMQHIPIAYGIDEPLAFYRHTKNSLSRNKFALVKYNIAVYEQVLGFSWIKSRYHFYCRFMPKYFLKKGRDFYRNKVSAR